MKMLHQFKVMGLSALLAVSSSAMAQDVTLNSLDGTLSITGELVDYDSDNYSIASNIGTLVVAVDAVDCVGEACPSLMPRYSEFTISGSRELALNLMPSLLDGFSASLGLDIIQQNDENGSPQVLFAGEDGEDVAKISFAMLGSSSGLQDLLNGAASMALTTRLARPSEVSAFSSAGLGNIRAAGAETILALDGMVVVTSNRNPVRIISSADIARIFSGEVNDWSELGGPAGEINLYVRPENSGTGSVFSQAIMRPARKGFSLRVNVMGSDTEVVDAVVSDPNGIGFTSFANSGNANPISLLGTCNVQSPASSFAIQAEEYPFARRMYLYHVNSNTPPLAKMFIEYLGTAEAQQLIESTGYVGQNVAEVPVNDQGLRFLSAALPTDAEVTLEQLHEMMTDLATAQRLTITLRFEQGTVQLDSRALADVERLAALMQEGQFEGKKIILMGFTDSVGRTEINESLSLTRAEQVREALILASGGTIDPSRIEVRGYGELSPLGCNEVTEGRRINRRVEVWTR